MSNPRKLAAIDIAFLGYRFVLAEYATGVFFSAALALFVLYRGHSFWQVLLGIYLVCLGINYLPILACAVSMASKEAARAELGAESSGQGKGHGQVSPPISAPACTAHHTHPGAPPPCAKSTPVACGPTSTAPSPPIPPREPFNRGRKRGHFKRGLTIHKVFLDNSLSTGIIDPVDNYIWSVGPCSRFSFSRQQFRPLPVRNNQNPIL
jgi:hypothetical protein